MSDTAWVHMLGESVEFVEGDEYVTRALKAGEGEKPPLLLLHGIGGHAETYVRNMIPLAERLEDRAVYAIDFVGHGSPPSGRAMTSSVIVAIAASISSPVRCQHAAGPSHSSWLITRFRNAM